LAGDLFANLIFLFDVIFQYMSKKKTTKEEKDNVSKSKDQINNETLDSNATENGSPQEAKDEAIEEPKEIDPMADLQKQLNESKDKYLRLSAEFDNYRKRTQREKMDLIRFGSEDILKAILPLVDDFERAMKSTQNTTDIEAVKQGLVLIHGKFSEFLKNSGVQVIDALGQDLDTDLHEAITKIPVQDETQKGKIVDVVEKGYKLNDKVIRFAKVVMGE
jgi:molecular chaperone GrpE